MRVSTFASQVVLRLMAPADVPAVLAVQQTGAVVALAKVFPQHRFPFPREAVARRWLEEIESHEADCYAASLSNCGAPVRRNRLMTLYSTVCEPRE